MKKVLSIFVVLTLFTTLVLNNLISIVSAQLISPNPISQPSLTSNCLNLAYNQTIGSRDYNTNGEVSQLQAFLAQNGFLNHIPTGYFGVLTRAAVAQYQTVNNIYPNVGYLGPLTRASINQNTCNQVIPNTSTNQPSYYCDQNGIKYNNEAEYKQNCVSITYTYLCQSNGITYNSQVNYNNNCLDNNINNNNNTPSNTAYFYCSLNGQTYYNVSDYQNYCRNVNNNTLPICNVNYLYTNTNSCTCPTGYTFLNVNGNYQCDNNLNYACTMIYVSPSATSSTYDRCHYPYYCQYDNLYHNDYNYCKPIPPTNNICQLNVTNQGGGFVATNDCSCPAGSNRINTGNYGEVYTWICQLPSISICQTSLISNDNRTCNNSTIKYCALDEINQGGGFVATNDCICPTGSIRADLEGSGEIYR